MATFYFYPFISDTFSSKTAEIIQVAVKSIFLTSYSLFFDLVDFHRIFSCFNKSRVFFIFREILVQSQMLSEILKMFKFTNFQMNRAKGGRKATDKPASPPKTICYCEGQRELGTLELFCAMCQKWFHHRCLKDMKEL